MGDEGTTVTADEVTSVRKSVTVGVDREHAFSVFTDGFDTWWMRSHHIGEAELDKVVIEPRAGGRWYERGVDGRECDWGYVIDWQPPVRLVLAWQLNAQWDYDRDLVTEVEVTFTEESPSKTRVDFEHRNLERMGAAAPEVRASLDSDGGWTGLLRLYAEAANNAQ